MGHLELLRAGASLIRGRPTVFADFRKGINSQADPYALKPTECRDALNVYATSAGSVKKRDGTTSFATPETTLTSIFSASSPDVFIAHGGTKLYSITSGGTVATLKTTLTSGLRWEFIQAPVITGQGPIYGMNGTDTPQQWDGVAAGTSDWTATVGTRPNGKYMIYHANRVWVAGITATPYRVAFSAPGDPRDWPASNVVDFEPTDGDFITGLGKVGQYLLVFKKRKIYVVTDNATGANRRIASGVGCVAHRSIHESPYGTYFLSDDQGVLVTTGTSLDQGVQIAGNVAQERVSYPIEPLLRDASTANLQYSAGVVHKGSYYLTFPSNAGTRTVQYDPVNEAWWIHSIGANQWTQTASPSVLHGADSTGARVVKAFVPSISDDLGLPFQSFWWGPWLTFNSPYLRKRCRQIHFDGNGIFNFEVFKSFETSSDQDLTTSIDLTIPTDTYGGSGNFGGSGAFGGAAEQATEAKLYSLGVGRAWSVKVSSTVAQPFTLLSYSMAMQDRTE